MSKWSVKLNLNPVRVVIKRCWSSKIINVFSHSPSLSFHPKTSSTWALIFHRSNRNAWWILRVVINVGFWGLNRSLWNWRYLNLRSPREKNCQKIFALYRVGLHLKKDWQLFLQECSIQQSARTRYFFHLRSKYFLPILDKGWHQWKLRNLSNCKLDLHPPGDSLKTRERKLSWLTGECCVEHADFRMLLFTKPFVTLTSFVIKKWLYVPIVPVFVSWLRLLHITKLVTYKINNKIKKELRIWCKESLQNDVRVPEEDLL